jgi:hypothetical protein
MEPTATTTDVKRSKKKKKTLSETTFIIATQLSTYRKLLASSKLQWSLTSIVIKYQSETGNRKTAAAKANGVIRIDKAKVEKMKMQTFIWTVLSSRMMKLIKYGAVDRTQTKHFVKWKLE